MRLIKRKAISVDLWIDLQDEFMRGLFHRHSAETGPGKWYEINTAVREA